jgi:hypothetical protein
VEHFIMAKKLKTPVAPPLALRFRVALENAGMTQAGWAADHGYAANHVSEVVRDNRTSAPVLALVAAFIADQEHAIAARVRVPATL